MLRLGSALLSLAALPLAVSVAHAGVFEDYFGKPTRGQVCYTRDYAASELGANPAQRISGVRILLGPTTQLGRKNRSASFDLALGLRRKGGKEWYSRVAYCSTQGQEFHCSLESDGGHFALARAGRRGLRLHTEGLAIEGDSDFLEIGATSLGYLTSRVEPGTCRKAGVKVR